MYRNIDLIFHLRLSPDGKRLKHSVESPYGEHQQELDFNLPEIPFRDRWPWQVPEDDRVKKFGAAVFEMLFPGALYSTFLRGLDDLYSNGQLRLMIDAPEPRVAFVPWELAYDPRRQEFIALDPRIPVVRLVQTPDTVHKISPSEQLQILVALPSPADLAQLDLEREKQMLLQALEIPVQSGKIELTFLERPVTLDKLHQALSHQEYDILHLSGHGVIDSTEKRSLLLIEDDNSKSDALTPEKFATLVRGSGLKLISLMAMGSAAYADVHDFQSTAASLVHAGVPAVVGLQGGVMDESAIRFVRTFYASIADGMEMERALTEARRTIHFTTQTTIEWAIPVLYSAAGLQETALFLPYQINVEQRTGTVVGNIGGGSITGESVGINVSQTVSNVDIGGQIKGIRIGDFLGSKVDLDEVSEPAEPLVSAEEIRGLIGSLKKAVSAEPSLSPRERIKGMSRVEALRFAVSGDSVDHEQVLNLLTEISDVGPKPAEILTDVRKRLASE
ncbi:MAG: CHAT domain-containing protein [Anaerolineales bacterium]